MTDSDRLLDALDRFRRVIEAKVEPAIAGDDPEALHDLRVAVRRTRSGLKHSQGVLKRTARDRFAADFSWLQDETGPARDYEVWMADLPDGDPLKLVLAGHHDAARRRADNALSSRRTTKVLARWHMAIASTSRGKKTLSSRERIETQHGRVMAAARRASVEGPAKDLHRLRKRVKELRYLLELFAVDDESGEAKAESKAMRKALKRVQTDLGAVQDATVQKEWLAAHSDEVGVHDVRVKELDEREAAARIAFGEHFARFAALTC